MRKLRKLLNLSVIALSSLVLLALVAAGCTNNNSFGATCTPGSGFNYCYVVDFVNNTGELLTITAPPPGDTIGVGGSGDYDVEGVNSCIGVTASTSSANYSASVCGSETLTFNPANLENPHNLVVHTSALIPPVKSISGTLKEK
jgi:hypothetical protein